MTRSSWHETVGSWRFWLGAGLVGLALLSALALEGEPGRCLRRARDCDPLVEFMSGYAVFFLALPGAAFVAGLTAPPRPWRIGFPLGVWNAAALLAYWLISEPEIQWFTSVPVRLGLEVWAAVSMMVVFSAVVTTGLVGRASGAIGRRLESKSR